MLRRVFSGIHSRPAISLTKSVAFEYLNRKSVRLSGIIYLQRNMATSSGPNPVDRLAYLRDSFKKSAIDAYIVPTDDAHQSEYIDDVDKRRQFLTGFTGSSGIAVVTQEAALLWTDGRYYQQAANELDPIWTLMKDGLTTTPSITDWLVKNLRSGARVGADGNLISYRLWSTWAACLEAKGITLEHITSAALDEIWVGRPKRTSNPIIELALHFCGKTIKEKLDDVRAEMRAKDCSLLMLTALDEIAWLFNLRGSDIKYNPVFFAYALVTLDELHLFVDETKLPSDFKSYCTRNNVTIALHPYFAPEAFLSSKMKDSVQGRVWISSSSSYVIVSLVPCRWLYQEITPVCTLKAIKNDVEVQGFVDCHISDGIALCQFFAWLENAVQNGKAVDEISAADKLEEFRTVLPDFKGLSFPTISGSGSNAAIIHYEPKEDTKRPITVNDMYLCDSGAQFSTGTTDVTRTWHFGKPTAHQIDCFTRVLKGQISLGTTIFPNKVKGCFLDTFARRALWDVGLDYAHGTGHGVGHFLNVHEGPQGISSIRIRADDPGLQANMFVSNEPGYYEDGQFGIRIEDIVQIVPVEVESNFGGRGALTFKTVTMCPIQTKLINPSLLTEKEKNYINDYHKKVFETLSPKFIKTGDDLTLNWLKKETQSI